MNEIYGNHFQIIISEAALWAVTDEQQKTVRALCKEFKIPQAIRRIIRFIGQLVNVMIFIRDTKKICGIFSYFLNSSVEILSCLYLYRRKSVMIKMLYDHLISCDLQLCKI